MGIARGVPFCPPEHLATYAKGVFGRLHAEGHLRDRSRQEFLDGLTELVADLNALHPFREGNGRTLRAFTRQLAAVRQAAALCWGRRSEHTDRDLELGVELAADPDPTVRGNIGAALAVLDAETVARAVGLEATLGELQQDPYAGVRQRARRPEHPPGATP